jgi:diguanylate cyclase (GGDEF)-like protein/PAS domain S-box-containing protein
MNDLIKHLKDFNVLKTLQTHLSSNNYIKQQYKFASENLSWGICNTTLEGRFISLNETFCCILGYEKKELLTMGFSDVTYHEDIAKSNNFRDRLMSGEKNITSEKRYVKKDGSIVWVIITISLLKNKKEEPKYFIVGIFDITERKKTEESLLKKEKTLVESQKIAKLGSYDWDIINQRWECSRQLVEIFGIEKGNDNKLRDGIKLIHPEYRKKIFEYFKYVAENKKIFDREFKIIGANDKKIKWVHALGEIIYSKEGKAVQLIGTVQDITEGKELYGALVESETRNQTMLANVSDIIAIIDKEGSIKYISPNSAYVFSMFPGDMLGKSVWSTVYEEDIERLKLDLASLSENKGGKTIVEYRHLHRSGRVSNIELTAVNLIDDQTINGILLTYHDITQKKIWESEIIYLSHHDTLTGLYNRFFFDEEVRRLDTKRQMPISVIMGDINGLKLINDAFGHNEGDKLLITIANILKKSLRTEDILARVGGDEFAVILPKTSADVAEKIINSIYLKCIEFKKKDDSDLHLISISLGYATKENESITLDEILEEAEIGMYKRKLLESKSIHSSIMSTIKTSMIEKSHNTQEHAERLINYSKSIAKAMKLSNKQVNDLELLATLHDLGKIGIDKKILEKRGALSRDEDIEIRRHPEIGYRIAKSSPDLVQLSELILCHHECWDGSGYPQGLIKEEIPLLSRIISIVDAYDAMVSDRPYKKAIKKEDAISEIERCKGSQFDPDISDIFVKILRGA